MEAFTDEEIVIGVKEETLKILYEKYYTRLCFYASRYIRDMEASEDVVQEVFVTMWEKKFRFPNETALNAFLYTTVYNACLNKLSADNRHHKHHENIRQSVSESDEPDYQEGRIEEEVMWKIFSAIDALPEECRKVFKLSYLDGLDLKQVADTLDISVHTVKSQRARAKKLLQERLHNLFPYCALFFFL